MKRREFLRTLLASAVAAAVPGSVISAATPEKRSSVTVFAPTLETGKEYAISYFASIGGQWQRFQKQFVCDENKEISLDMHGYADGVFMVQVEEGVSNNPYVRASL